jgi:hypothetical protein
MNNSSQCTKLIFNGQRANDDTAPDDVIKSLWVSTALALILSLPSLAVFLSILQWTDNILVGGVAGFTAHFILLALSPRTSEVLLSLFE